MDQSGGGYFGNVYVLDPDNRRVQVGTGHGPFAIAESADVWARLHSSFSPLSPDATVSWDIAWSGYATAFVGADAAAQARITVRVRESTGGVLGPVVFERVVEDDGVGAALQGVATLQMNGSDGQRVVLPPLDPTRIYRVEAELHCRSRVAFSVGATVCAFDDGPTSGLTVNGWHLVFDNVPAH